MALHSRARSDVKTDPRHPAEAAKEEAPSEIKGIPPDVVVEAHGVETRMRVREHLAGARPRSIQFRQI